MWHHGRIRVSAVPSCHVDRGPRAPRGTLHDTGVADVPGVRDTDVAVVTVVRPDKPAVRRRRPCVPTSSTRHLLPRGGRGGVRAVRLGLLAAPRASRGRRRAEGRGGGLGPGPRDGRQRRGLPRRRHRHVARLGPDGSDERRRDHLRAVRPRQPRRPAAPVAQDGDLRRASRCSRPPHEASADVAEVPCRPRWTSRCVPAVKRMAPGEADLPRRRPCTGAALGALRHRAGPRDGHGPRLRRRSSARPAASDSPSRCSPARCRPRPTPSSTRTCRRSRTATRPRPVRTCRTPSDRHAPAHRHRAEAQHRAEPRHGAQRRALVVQPRRHRPGRGHVHDRQPGR